MDIEKGWSLDWKLVILIVIIIMLLSGALYFTLSQEECLNEQCFQSNMIECKSATYVNSEPEASWFYEIEGESSDLCEIEVTLLSARQGKIGLRKYEKHSMRCFYDSGTWAYPEKDLTRCHGLLKEDLQQEIIDKLHGYIIDNLGEINEALGELENVSS